MTPSSIRVRELLGNHGDLTWQDEVAWSARIPLPDDLATFYREVGPVDITIEGYGNPTFIPSLQRLWDFQAGYRWHGNSGELLDSWNPDWLVVASEGGDPYIYSMADRQILFAHHGQGHWDPAPCFSNINQMVACLAEIGNVVLSAGGDLTDEDSYIRPKYRAAAIERLMAIVGDAETAESLIKQAGWG